MANKTPYEIRSELLALAQKICYDQSVARSGKNELNEAPTTERIIEEAEKLNVFVSSAKSSK